MPVEAQGSCIDGPYISVEFQAPTDGEYNFWLRSALIDNAPSSIDMAIDNQSSCFQFEAPGSTNFEWTSGSNGAINSKLTAGIHSLKLAVKNGNLKTSKMIITGDKQCVPEGTGDNCLDKNLDIRIDGLQPNQTIEKYLKISTVLSGAELTSPKVEYFFDNNETVYAVSTAAPFCLFTANNACVQGDVSFLGDGNHSITIVISATNMETTSRTIPFTLITNTSLSLPETSLSPPKTPELSTVITPPPVQNSTIIIGNNANLKPPVVTGRQTVTIAPNQPLRNGDTVQYSVDGTPVATSTITDKAQNPSAKLDLKDTSGNAKITATLNRNDGSKEIYNLTAEVDNSTKATTGKWLQNGGFRFIATTVSIILLGAGGFLLYKIWNRRRAFSAIHNLNNYQYVQPEKNMAAYSMPPLAIVVFAGGMIFHAFASATPVQVGVAIDLTRETIPAGYSLVTNESERYVTMTSVNSAQGESTNSVAPSEQPIITAGAFYQRMVTLEEMASVLYQLA